MNTISLETGIRFTYPMTLGNWTLITLTDVNKILEMLLGQKHPKIRTRAFRPALPSISAREGASEESHGQVDK